MSQVIEQRPENGPGERPRALNPESFAELAISRWEIRLRATQAAVLPTFSGSTLRGTFGHALKQTVCVMNHGDCGRCLVADKCIYPYVFETPAPPDLPILRNQKDAPHPFILDPPLDEAPLGPPREQSRRLAAGDEMVFGLTLMGRAIEYMPYLIYAVHEMARRGLGQGRATFELSEVSALDAAGERRVIYTESSQRLDGAGHDALDLSQLIAARLARSLEAGSRGREIDSLRLRFITPTRIKTRDDLQPQADFALLIRSLLRRISMLLAVHGRQPLELDFRGLLERAAAVRTGFSSLRWRDWTRYSSRQQTKMQLGGFIGEVVFEGSGLGDCWPLLIAGEILRVGNGTSFGLGRYELL